MDRDTLKKTIIIAFDDVRRPSMDSMIRVSPDVLDVAGAEAVVSVLANEGRWQDISLRALVSQRGDLYYLSSKGLHYVFPAALIAVLCRYDECDTLPDSLISMLSIPAKSSEQMNSLWSLFTRDQLVAVREWVAWVAEAYPDDLGQRDRKLILDNINSSMSLLHDC